MQAKSGGPALFGAPGEADKTRPPVGLVMGSDSDWPVMAEAWNALKELGLSSDVAVASAHRTPERVREWAESAERRGLRVIIAGAGGAAHLPGVVASWTRLPVIGVPIALPSAEPARAGAPLGGLDALLSIVQMPPGVPVACVGINAARNAAILAARILAVTDPDLGLRLEELRRRQAQGVAERERRLLSRLAEAAGAPGVGASPPGSQGAGEQP